MLLIISTGFGRSVQAVTQTIEEAGVSISLYGPDWIWQRRDVNILVVGRNRTDHTVQLELILRLPDASGDAFNYDGPERVDLILPPGETKRTAFTGLTASDGVPLDTYPLIVECKIDGKALVFDYPVKFIRGGVVRPGVWAVLAPAFLAGLWCILIVLYLSRIGRPGAWRKPGEPPLPVHRERVPHGD
ncbi:hypothetical protein ACFLT7_00365 [candidate division KSB1 bacterium]